ncbi:hypothetical protein A3Q32_01605 [Alcanivorax sp. KX64203]|nr:hypothetical protein A3Q32_01605 [Alcanivorax sp. KX64203]
MRYFCLFLCSLVLSACDVGSRPDVPASNYQDEFLLLSHQSVSRPGYENEFRINALLRTRIDTDHNQDDDALWLRTTLPWMSIDTSMGRLDTRDLSDTNQRQQETLRMMSAGTLSRIKNGEIVEIRPGEPELHDRLMAKLDPKLKTLTGNNTPVAVPGLPADPQPGDHWSEDTAFIGLPEAEARFQVLDRDGDRVLLKADFEGDSVTGAGRLVARLPSGMPVIALLAITVEVPGSDAGIHQRLALVSQRHYQRKLDLQGINPLRVRFNRDMIKRQLDTPSYTGYANPLHDRAALDRFADALTESLFYTVQENRLPLEGDTALGLQTEQIDPLFRSARSGQIDGLMVNRLAERNYLLGLPLASPRNEELLTVPAGANLHQLGQIDVTADLHIHVPGEPVVLAKDDAFPPGIQVARWQPRRVDLHFDGTTSARVEPLGADGEPLAFSALTYPTGIDQEHPDQDRWFTDQLTLHGLMETATYQTREADIAALRLIPLSIESRPVTFHIRPLPDSGDLHPPGVRHNPRRLPKPPEQPETLLRQLEVTGQNDNKVIIGGPPALRLCHLSVKSGAEDLESPPRFQWDWGARPDHERYFTGAFVLSNDDGFNHRFHDRTLTIEARCPSRVETVSVTPEKPGCARFQGDNGVVIPDHCGQLPDAGLEARDQTGLPLAPVGQDGEVRHFWGSDIQEVTFMRGHDPVTRTLTVTLPE